MATDTRAPTSDYASLATWSLSSGTTTYNLLSDASDSSYADCTALSASNAYKIFGSSAFTVPAGSTAISVQVVVRCVDVSSGNNNARGALRINGTYYYTGTSQVPNSAGALTHDFGATNPGSGSAWTVDEVNGSGTYGIQNWGISSTDVTPNVRWYEAYLQVTYTELAPIIKNVVEYPGLVEQRERVRTIARRIAEVMVPQGVQAGAGAPTAVFSDGYETGNFNGWSGTAVTTATITANAASLHAGSYGAESVINAPTDTNQRACSYRYFTATATNVTYFTFWLKVAAWTSGTGYQYGKGPFACLSGNTAPYANANEHVAFIDCVNTREMHLCYKAKDGSSTTVTGTFTPAVGSWYKVKVKLDQSGANPILTWWTSTDGSSWTQRGTDTDTTAGSNGVANRPATAAFGICPNLPWSSAVWTFHVDECAVYDSDPDVAPVAEVAQRIRGWIKGVVETLGALEQRAYTKTTGSGQALVRQALDSLGLGEMVGRTRGLRRTVADGLGALVEAAARPRALTRRLADGTLGLLEWAGKLPGLVLTAIRHGLHIDLDW